MTNISIEALKEKTIGEICELVKQAERLPENHSPQTKPIVVLHRELGRGRLSDGTDKTGDAKTQTAQELLEEIEDE